jgi:hypothetical protein
VWNNSTNPKLDSVAVGDTETVNFSFIPFGKKNDQIILNPESTFTLTIKANRNPENKVSDVIENSITKKIRLNSQITFKTWSEFNSKFFANSGPIPPKAEQKTSYTTVIELQNTTNILSGGVAKMKLPIYVQYEGVYAPQTERVTYDSVTREITWDVGTLAPKTGYTGGTTRQIALQVSIIPSVSQILTSPILLYDIFFEGKDMHTQSILTKTGEQITTVTKDSQDYFNGTVSR